MNTKYIFVTGGVASSLGKGTVGDIESLPCVAEAHSSEKIVSLHKLETVLWKPFP